MSLPVFENFTAYALLMGIFYASLCLFIAQIIRKKSKIMQNLYLPASLVAGIIGMIMGHEFLNWIPYSGQISGYASMLILPVFASIGLGYKEKHQGSVIKTISKVRDSFFAFGACDALQYGIFIIVGCLLIPAIFPGTNKMIGILLPSGFSGGYGTAASLGATMEGFGLEGATALGITFATLGLLIGVVGGVIQINIATRIGATKYAKSVNEIPEEMRSGWIPPDKRVSIGLGTMDASSIDPLGWHACVIFIAAGMAYMFNIWFSNFTGISVPALSWAIVFGYAIQALLNALKIGNYVEKKVVSRISSSLTDYLVFFGFVSVKKSIIIDNIGPILLLCLLGTLWVLFELWILGPMWFNSSWFEKSIYMYGMWTGVMATGITLLRIIDPDNKSGTLEDFGLAEIGLTWLSPSMLALCPVFMASGHILETGFAVLGVGILFIVAAIVCKSFRKFDKKNWNAEEFEKTVASEKR